MLKANIKRTIFEYYRPKTEKEMALFSQHRKTLKKVRQTGRCPCGASVLKESGNRLLDLGYLYGVECLVCR